MKHVNLLGVMASAICMASVAHGQSSTTADAGWAKMTQCAAIGDDRARHSCTDKALREAGLLTDATKAAAKRQAFGLQKSVEPLAAAAAQVRAPESPAATASPPKKEEREHLEVTLAKVEHSGDGKLVLTTAEGAVWHQVEGGAIPQMPKEGGTMKIEARSLGGFMCQPSKYVSFRCYRSK